VARLFYADVCGSLVLAATDPFWLNGLMNGEPASAPPPAELPPVPPPPQRKGMSKGCIIAIIVTAVVLAGGVVVLALLGIFGGRIVLDKARTLQTRAVMKGVEIAVKGYKTEYLRLPFITDSTPPSDNNAYDTTGSEGRALIDIILNKDLKKNPRQIRFWEPPPSKTTGSGFSATGGLVDSWGRQGYRIILDYDHDGLIDNPEGGSAIKADVILYSAGPDGDFSTWKDNVRSWK
jgi:hypothetical protein